MFNLKDRVAVITGAAGGIGRGIALALAKRGCNLALSDIDEAGLAKTAAEMAAHGVKVTHYRLDVSDAEQIAAFPARVLADHKGVDLIFNNAGVAIGGTFEQVSEADFDWLLSINLFGVVNGLVPAVDAMKGRGFGQVAIVGSVSGYGGLPLASAYGASKAAVNNMAEALKFDFDKMNIRIQVINPGFVDTPLTEKNTFPMPGLMKVEAATRRFADGLERGGFEVCFPRRLAWTLKLVNLLPHALYFPLMKRAMGWDKRPLKP